MAAADTHTLDPGLEIRWGHACRCYSYAGGVPAIGVLLDEWGRA